MPTRRIFSVKLTDVSVAAKDVSQLHTKSRRIAILILLEEPKVHATDSLHGKRATTTYNQNFLSAETP